MEKTFLACGLHKNKAQAGFGQQSLQPLGHHFSVLLGAMLSGLHNLPRSSTGPLLNPMSCHSSLNTPSFSFIFCLPWVRVHRIQSSAYSLGSRWDMFSRPCSSVLACSLFFFIRISMSWAGLTFIIVFLASRGGGSKSQGGCMLSCRREPSSIRANKRKRTGCEQGGHFCRLRGFQDIKQFRGINPSIHIAAIGFVLSQPGLWTAVELHLLWNSASLWLSPGPGPSLAFLLHSSLRL